MKTLQTHPAGRPRLASLVVALGTASFLAACGGSDEAPPEPPPQASNGVPASATVSALAFTQYAISLQASETGDPLVVSALMPPTSETDEPVALR
jgi:hypothetical protein